MKRLNDTNQFKKALSLYRNEIEKTNKPASSLVINQALKACVELSEIKHGKDIHKNLSPNLSHNSFIQINLIRLYSKFVRIQQYSKNTFVLYSEMWRI